MAFDDSNNNKKFETEPLLSGRTETEITTLAKKIEGSLKVKEQSAADGSEATYGQIWVKDDTPNSLQFTDDAGTDTPLTGITTSYLSISPAEWTTSNPDTDDIALNITSLTQTAGVSLRAPVQLPHGAIVTNVVVYGSSAMDDENWNLSRVLATDATSAELAGAAVNTADSTISNATIDNSTYSYAINLPNTSAGDILYGSIITYTTAKP